MATEKDVEAAAMPLVENAREAKAFTTTTQIQNQDELALMVSVIADIKDAEAKVIAARALFIVPIEEILAKFKSYFDPAVKDLAVAGAQGRARIDEYIALAEKTRSTMIDESESAPNEDVRESILIEADRHRVDPIAGLSIRTSWTGKVTDPALIPREYLVVDEKKLRAVTKAQKRDPKIPGWEAYPESSSAITAGKVERI